MFDNLATEASGLTRNAGRKTMSTNAVRGAVNLVLPGELAKHAV